MSDLIVPNHQTLRAARAACENRLLATNDFVVDVHCAGAAAFHWRQFDQSDPTAAAKRQNGANCCGHGVNDYAVCTANCLTAPIRAWMVANPLSRVVLWLGDLIHFFDMEILTPQLFLWRSAIATATGLPLDRVSVSTLSHQLPVVNSWFQMRELRQYAAEEFDGNNGLKKTGRIVHGVAGQNCSYLTGTANYEWFNRGVFEVPLVARMLNPGMPRFVKPVIKAQVADGYALSELVFTSSSTAVATRASPPSQSGLVACVMVDNVPNVVFADHEVLQFTRTVANAPNLEVVGNQVRAWASIQSSKTAPGLVFNGACKPLMLDALTQLVYEHACSVTRDRSFGKTLVAKRWLWDERDPPGSALIFKPQPLSSFQLSISHFVQFLALMLLAMVVLSAALSFSPGMQLMLRQMSILPVKTQIPHFDLGLHNRLLEQNASSFCQIVHGFDPSCPLGSRNSHHHDDPAYFMKWLITNSPLVFYEVVTAPVSEELVKHLMVKVVGSYAGLAFGVNELLYHHSLANQELSLASPWLPVIFHSVSTFVPIWVSVPAHILFNYFAVQHQLQDLFDRRVSFELIELEFGLEKTNWTQICYPGVHGLCLSMELKRVFVATPVFIDVDSVVSVGRLKNSAMFVELFNLVDSVTNFTSVLSDTVAPVRNLTKTVPYLDDVLIAGFGYLTSPLHALKFLDSVVDFWVADVTKEPLWNDPIAWTRFWAYWLGVSSGEAEVELLKPINNTSEVHMGKTCEVRAFPTMSVAFNSTMAASYSKFIDYTYGIKWYNTKLLMHLQLKPISDRALMWANVMHEKIQANVAGHKYEVAYVDNSSYALDLDLVILGFEIFKLKEWLNVFDFNKSLSDATFSLETPFIDWDFDFSYLRGIQFADLNAFVKNLTTYNSTMDARQNLKAFLLKCHPDKRDSNQSDCTEQNVLQANYFLEGSRRTNGTSATISQVIKKKPFESFKNCTCDIVESVYSQLQAQTALIANQTCEIIQEWSRDFRNLSQPYVERAQEWSAVAMNFSTPNTSYVEPYLELAKNFSDVLFNHTFSEVNFSLPDMSFVGNFSSLVFNFSLPEVDYKLPNFTSLSFNVSIEPSFNLSSFNFSFDSWVAGMINFSNFTYDSTNKTDQCHLDTSWTGVFHESKWTFVFPSCLEGGYSATFVSCYWQVMGFNFATDPIVQLFPNLTSHCPFANNTGTCACNFTEYRFRDEISCGDFREQVMQRRKAVSECPSIIGYFGKFLLNNYAVWVAFEDLFQRLPHWHQIVQRLQPACFFCRSRVAALQFQRDTDLAVLTNWTNYFAILAVAPLFLFVSLTFWHHIKWWPKVRGAQAKMNWISKSTLWVLLACFFTFFTNRPLMISDEVLNQVFVADMEQNWAAQAVTNLRLTNQVLQTFWASLWQTNERVPQVEERPVTNNVVARVPVSTIPLNEMPSRSNPDSFESARMPRHSVPIRSAAAPKAAPKSTPKPEAKPTPQPQPPPQLEGPPVQEQLETEVDEDLAADPIVNREPATVKLTWTGRTVETEFDPNAVIPGPKVSYNREEVQITLCKNCPARILTGSERLVEGVLTGEKTHWSRNALNKLDKDTVFVKANKPKYFFVAKTRKQILEFPLTRPDHVCDHSEEDDYKPFRADTHPNWQFSDVTFNLTREGIDNFIHNAKTTWSTNRNNPLGDLCKQDCQALQNAEPGAFTVKGVFVMGPAGAGKTTTVFQEFNQDVLFTAPSREMCSGLTAKGFKAMTHQIASHRSIDSSIIALDECYLFPVERVWLLSKKTNFMVFMGDVKQLVCQEYEGSPWFDLAMLHVDGLSVKLELCFRRFGATWAHKVNNIWYKYEGIQTVDKPFDFQIIHLKSMDPFNEFYTIWSQAATPTAKAIVFKESLSAPSEGIFTHRVMQGSECDTVYLYSDSPFRATAHFLVAMTRARVKLVVCTNYPDSFKQFYDDALPAEIADFVPVVDKLTQKLLQPAEVANLVMEAERAGANPLVQKLKNTPKYRYLAQRIKELCDEQGFSSIIDWSADKCRLSGELKKLGLTVIEINKEGDERKLTYPKDFTLDLVDAKYDELPREAQLRPLWLFDTTFKCGKGHNMTVRKYDSILELANLRKAWCVIKVMDHGPDLGEDGRMHFGIVGVNPQSNLHEDWNFFGVTQNSHEHYLVVKPDKNVRLSLIPNVNSILAATVLDQCDSFTNFDFSLLIERQLKSGWKAGEIWWSGDKVAIVRTPGPLSLFLTDRERSIVWRRAPSRIIPIATFHDHDNSGVEASAVDEVYFNSVWGQNRSHYVFSGGHHEVFGKKPLKANHFAAEVVKLTYQGPKRMVHFEHPQPFVNFSNSAALLRAQNPIGGNGVRMTGVPTFGSSFGEVKGFSLPRSPEVEKANIDLPIGWAYNEWNALTALCIRQIAYPIILPAMLIWWFAQFALLDEFLDGIAPTTEHTPFEEYDSKFDSNSKRKFQRARTFVNSEFGETRPLSYKVFPKWDEWLQSTVYTKGPRAVSNPPVWYRAIYGPWIDAATKQVKAKFHMDANITFTSGLTAEQIGGLLGQHELWHCTDYSNFDASQGWWIAQFHVSVLCRLFGHDYPQRLSTLMVANRVRNKTFRWDGIGSMKSGLPQTSLSNSLLNAFLVWLVCRILRIDSYKLLLSGDDAALTMAAGDFAAFRNLHTALVRALGMRVVGEVKHKYNMTYNSGYLYPTKDGWILGCMPIRGSKRFMQTTVCPLSHHEYVRQWLKAEWLNLCFVPGLREWALWLRKKYGMSDQVGSWLTRRLKYRICALQPHEIDWPEMSNALLWRYGVWMTETQFDWEAVKFTEEAPNQGWGIPWEQEAFTNLLK